MPTLKEELRKHGFSGDYDWGLYPKAEQYLNKHINDFLNKHAIAKKLAKKIEKETSTRIVDWIDQP